MGVISILLHLPEKYSDLPRGIKNILWLIGAFVISFFIIIILFILIGLGWLGWWLIILSAIPSVIIGYKVWEWQYNQVRYNERY